MSLGKLLLAALLSSLPRSTEEWTPGDLAVCIDDRWADQHVSNPREGDYLRVRHVCMAGLFLHFEGKPENRHWLAAKFRKVKPDTEPAADEQWVEQLERFRKKVPA